MEQFQAAAQRRVHDSAHASYRSFVDLSPLPAVFTDNELRIIEANRGAFQLFGKEDLIGSCLYDLARASEDLRSALVDGNSEAEFIISGETVVTEIFLRNEPGNGWLFAINDISGRRQAERTSFASEKQKWKIQRTEALERLAGGIAHEFNNYLAVILLQTDMIDLQLTEDNPLANRVKEIKAVANDAASIVRQLLAFGRRQSMNPAPLMLNSLFAAAERDLRALVGGSISVEFDLAPDLGVCFVDHGQIVQAMMYLTLHARETMPNGGTLTFRTTNIAKGGALIHRTQTSGSYIQIEVSDTGTGIDTRVADYIFEPFFAKKGSKENTGLALATVYGIVKQLGGYVWVTSEQGEGTTFKMQFPRIDEPRPQKSVESQKSNGTVLLVDDEASVRRVAAEALRGAGYRVVEASSGEEAVEIARNFPDRFDLVVADYSLPAMNGSDACDRISESHKDVKVLFISGDPSSVTRTESSQTLDKPFSLRQLLERVSTLLST